MSLQEEKVLYYYKHKPSESWIFDIIMVSIGIPFLIIWAKLFDGIGINGASLWVCFVFVILLASVAASVEKSSYRLIITNHKVEIRGGSNSESIMMHRVEAVDYEGHVVVVRGSGGTEIKIVFSRNSLLIFEQRLLHIVHGVCFTHPFNNCP